MKREVSFPEQIRSPERAVFKRRSVVLENSSRSDDSLRQPPLPVQRTKVDSDLTVLVINSSQVMAKEITLQLTLGIPGCSIMYAPSIELAKWILRRRRIGLVVSSPILPDGGIARLKPTLEQLEAPPDVVVVGNLNAQAAAMLDNSVYEFTAVRRLGEQQQQPEKFDRRLRRRIADLGADLRNDLNNPLQEIVAMVFVAQATGAEGNPSTNQALHAIDAAAKNMSKVVNELEEKIRSAVERNAFSGNQQ